MSVVDPKQIRAAAQALFGPLAEGPATFGVLPEGLVYETADRAPRRLMRPEPCLFLGPPARSKLLIVVAILDRSETAENPVRELATVAVTDLGGVWASGLEDAYTRFPVKEIAPARPELLALEAGTLVYKLNEARPAPLAKATPAIAVGREKAGARRRAIVLVRGPRALEPAYYEESAQ